MNIHPIFVHFPVALLTVYSLMELFRYKKITSHEAWFFIKAFVVAVGTLGSYAAFMAGDPAEHLYLMSHSEMRGILQIHELWATITVTIFSIIAIIYIVQFFRRIGQEQKILDIPLLGILWKVISFISDLLYKPFILVTLAFCGLCAVTLTGAFGGSLVYGSSSDPFITLIYKIFIK